MKVGILTFHNAYNYGAILQTYATQELVKMYGHDAVIIDYRNNAVEYTYKKKTLKARGVFRKRFWETPKYIYEKYLYRKQRKAYHTFVKKYLCLSASVKRDDINNELMGYDLFLIGSDQLWNKKITGGFDPLYWGDFRSNPNAQKVAWSICMNDTDEHDIKYISDHLNNFDAISVREDTLKTFLSPLTKKEIIQTMDPTFLLPVSCWEKLCHPVKVSNYIAVYALHGEDQVLNMAIEIARELGKKVVFIHAYSRMMTKQGIVHHVQSGGPTEFLSYIRYADMVVTTSFHGTAFSLIFEKKFICFEPLGKKNTRVRSLLRIYGLEDRIVDNAQCLPDFERKAKDVSSSKQISLTFFKKVLN